MQPPSASAEQGSASGARPGRGVRRAARARPPRIPSRARWAWRAAAVALCASLATAPARAAVDAQSRTLRLKFAEGYALEIAGRWADALDRFVEVGRARPTPEVEFHVALCQERLGRLVEAEQGYRRARERARDGGPLDAREARAASRALVVREAEERLADLEPRVPRVVVLIAGDATDVEVLLDGAALPSPSPHRVNPGPHVAVAVREGLPIAAVAFAAQEARTRHVTLVVLPRAAR